jgi:hypothetical protein
MSSCRAAAVTAFHLVDNAAMMAVTEHSEGTDVEN